MRQSVSIVIAEFQQSNVAAGCPAVLSDNLTLTTEILIVTRPRISPLMYNISDLHHDIPLHEACS